MILADAARYNPRHKQPMFLPPCPHCGFRLSRPIGRDRGAVVEHTVGCFFEIVGYVSTLLWAILVFPLLLGFKGQRRACLRCNLAWTVQ